MTSSTRKREFDLILWGATGYTGKLTATVFSRRYGLSNISIALAGRNFQRLEAVAQLMLREALQSSDPAIREDAKQVQAKADRGERILPLIEVKDIQAEAKSLCARTSVIIAAAGPFIQVGEPIIAEAARCGTDYVDVTGEVGWVKSMKDKYDEIAKANKARIIPCCGFDYLLNDVGIFCVQDYSRLRPGCISPVQEIDQLFVSVGSRVSGGTLRTMFHMMKSISLFNIFAGKASDPFEFCDKELNPEIKAKNKNVLCSRFSPIAKSWMAPHVMTPMMKQYIHWTNEIHNYPYGRDFIFKVGEKSGGFFSSLIKTVSTLFALLTLIITSKVEWLAKLVANPSGEGRPTSELETEGNCIQMQTVGLVKHESEPPTQVDYTITFSKGEGYMLTAWGALEAAITCLKARTGVYPSTNQFGFGCPTQLLGSSLIDQLKLAGFHFDLKEIQQRSGGRS